MKHTRICALLLRLVHYWVRYHTESALFLHNEFLAHNSSTIRFLNRCGLRCKPGEVVRRRLFGVYIGGVPWQVGRHCLYEAADGATHLGTVLDMFKGRDDMDDEFVVFRVENKPITAYMGHFCFFSNDSRATVLVLWNRILWMCKMLTVREGQVNLGLPFVSCTSRERVEFT